MGTFNTRVTLNGRPTLIPAIADRICQEFADKGYEINRENLMSGGVDISITKGGIFKAVVGMKTALKITLVPQTDSIKFDAGVGIFGQQALPTVISMLFFWPVLLTQIWGIVKQSNLDDKALAIARDVINEHAVTTPPPIFGTGVGSGYGSASGSADNSRFAPGKFCTACGTRHADSARFCSNCGSPLN